MAVGTSWLATDTVLPVVFPVSVAALAWPRVADPRASPRRPAVRDPLHAVCVLLARPMFRGTRLPGHFFLVRPIVSRTPADCGPACWARTHPANAQIGAADHVRPRSLWYLSTPLHRVATMGPGFLETWAAWPFISRYCSPVVCPGEEVSNKGVSRRAVARTWRWGVWARSVLASRCPCAVM